MTEAEPTALYHIYGDDDLLLYIGVSNNFGTRWQQHAKVQSWWDEKRDMAVHWHDSRKDAEAAEIAAIKAEKPKHNKQHASAALPRTRPQTAGARRPSTRPQTAGARRPKCMYIDVPCRMPNSECCYDGGTVFYPCPVLTLVKKPEQGNGPTAQGNILNPTGA